MQKGALGDLDDEVDVTGGAGQQTGCGPRPEDGRLEVHEQCEPPGQPVGDGVIDGGVAARLVELVEPALPASPREGGFGRDPESGPARQRLGTDHLAGREIEDRLVLGLEEVPVEEVVKGHRLQLGHEDAFPVGDANEVWVPHHSRGWSPSTKPTGLATSVSDIASSAVA